MPRYLYSFKSDVGPFWIRQERDKSWSLCIGDDIIEEICHFDSAVEAADAVHMQTTGWDEWDYGAENDAPTGLLGWKKKLVR